MQWKHFARVRWDTVKRFAEIGLDHLSLVTDVVAYRQQACRSLSKTSGRRARAQGKVSAKAGDEGDSVGRIGCNQANVDRLRSAQAQEGQH